MELIAGHTSSTTKPGDSSPAAWFEFVLDETLLERHLIKPDAVPSAADLISLFLYQSDVSANVAREISCKESANTNGDKAPGNIQNKKIVVLKLLAIKTACHLKWSLTHLETILPMSILKTLLHELLKVVDLNAETMIKSRDLTGLTPEAVFAVLLYHRWAVSTIVRNSFPQKPSKVPTVQVPGLLDPSVSSASMKDAVLKIISENILTSMDVLESFVLSGGQDAIMPTPMCLGSVVNEVDNVVNNWTNGTVVNASEMICQVSFDVGCIYFQQQNYEKADCMFQICKEHFSKLSNPFYADIDEARLHGYLCACGGILGRTAPNNFGKPLTLYQKVLASVQNNFQGLTGLLIEDLQKQELSWTFRATLEESTHLAKRLDSLYEEVLVCNTLRRALDGHVAMFDLVKTLNRTVGLVDFFVQVCLDIYSSLNEVQKENLRLFLRNLCHTVSSSTRFSQKLMSCNLATLFSETERDNLMCRIGIKKSTIPLETTSAYPPPLDENLKVGEMEQELLVTYDPAVIKDLVQKVASKVGNNQAVFLTDLWRLPPDIQSLITTLHVTNMTPLMCTHVLIAKARICIQLLQYDTARSLLLAADSCIKDLSYKLSKLIRWEILKVDLLQINGGDCLWVAGGSNDPMIQELAKRAKACINSMQLENSDILPTAELQCYCVAFLLNLKDWDFLSGLANVRFSGFVQFGQLIAVLCKEVPQLKAARASASKFIEAVSLTFYEPKRVGAGGPSNTQRDFRGPVLLQDMLTTFITIIKEPMVLSLFVSCVTKLVNWACIDITEEIFSDYVALWPNSMPESIELNQINTACVTEVVVTVMDHVLSVNPRHPSWLRTQADIHFAQNNHWNAMRYYLELGVVTTDYFSETVTKNVYNEQVYRRMIRCCSQLNNHTQVAIMCQFLDEMDYTIAFKSLQERTTTDAMDAYYDCIWDTTILEYLINLHTRKGELDKRQLVLKLIGQMELNSNNREDVLNEAARVRKSRFLRMLSRQFLVVPLYKPAASTSLSS